MLKESNRRFLLMTLPRIIASLLVVYGILFSIWTIFYTETGNGDNVEHIHATWLIAYGQVPYRDFFQHHNPLLWYLFAPLIRFFYNQLTILDVAHGIGIIAGLITFFVAYKISVKFFSSARSALLSLLILCPPYFYIFCFNFNPDTFMALSFAIGVYSLFSYIDKKDFKYLIISFMSFFIAFMFTQKILIILGQLGVICLYIFIKQKMSFTHVFYALLMPIILSLLFVSYLYYQDCLGIYWKSNYTFNFEMQKFYGVNKISVVGNNALALSVILSCISVLFLTLKGNIYFKIISILFITEILQRYLYFSISPYYMLPLMLFMVCLNSSLIDKIMRKNEYLIYIFLLIALFYAGITKQKYLNSRGQDRTFARYITANTTPCDYMVSGFLGNQSIFTKNPHYYWSLLGHVDIVGEKLNIAPKPNLNQIVEQYKPKIIYGGNYWNNYYLNQGQHVLSQKINQNLIDKYYLPTPFNDFYILKYKYRHQLCQYNKEKKVWRYLDE